MSQGLRAHLYTMARLQKTRHFPGYKARRRATLNTDILIISAVVLGGLIFVALATAFSIRTGIMAVAAFIFLAGIFLGPDLLFYAFVFLISIPMNMYLGSFMVFVLDFALLLMFAMVVIKASREKRFRYPAGIYILACSLYLVTMSLSSLASERIFLTLPEIVQRFYYILVVPFIVVNLVNTVQDIYKYLRFQAYTLIFHAFLVIVQYNLAMQGNFVITDLFTYANRGGYVLRSFGAMGPGAGLYLGLGCAVFYSWFMKSQNPLAKIFCIMAVGLCLFATICTGTKSATVFICVALLVLVLYHRKYLQFMVAMAVFVVGLLFVVRFGPEIYPFKLFFHTTAFRQADMEDALETFEQNIVFGAGPKQSVRKRGYKEIHGVENELLAQLAEGGIVGVTTYLFLVFSVFACLIPAYKSRDPMIFDSGGMLFGSFMVITMSVFTVSNMFFGGEAHFYALLAGYIMVVKRETEKKTSTLPAGEGSAASPGSGNIRRVKKRVVRS